MLSLSRATSLKLRPVLWLKAAHLLPLQAHLQALQAPHQAHLAQAPHQAAHQALRQAHHQAHPQAHLALRSSVNNGHQQTHGGTLHQQAPGVSQPILLLGTPNLHINGANIIGTLTPNHGKKLGTLTPNHGKILGTLTPIHGKILGTHTQNHGILNIIHLCGTHGETLTLLPPIGTAKVGMILLTGELLNSSLLMTMLLNPSPLLTPGETGGREPRLEAAAHLPLHLQAHPQAAPAPHQAPQAAAHLQAAHHQAHHQAQAHHPAQAQRGIG
jgi:hypothetical protein